MKDKNKQLRSVLRTKKILVVPATVLATITAFFLGLLLKDSLAAPAKPWPAVSDWNLITQNGTVAADYEERFGCQDLTIGGATPSQENDIGSQAKCKNTPKYNPGFGTSQPGATAQNTYSGALSYLDANSDSTSCSNISDDDLFFRMRLSDTPFESSNKGLKDNVWYATLDTNNDGNIEFYVRLNGHGQAENDSLQILHEESTGGGDPLNNDPTGEPVIATYANPLDSQNVRVSETPDNGTVGDTTEYFLDIRVPLADFRSTGSPGTQKICSGDSIVIFNYSTSENAKLNEPFKKDKMMDGASDPIIIGPPPVATTSDLSVTKTDSATNSTPGTPVTYTIVVTNNGPDAVTGASVTDTFPGSLSNVSWTCTASSGSSCTASGTGNVSDSLVNLLNSGTATYTITADIGSGATGSLSNTANVTAPSGTTDPDTSNNQATDTNTLTPVTDLVIAKSGPATVLAGNDVTYTITVTNNGPSDATDVTIYDALPDGVHLGSATPTSGSCTQHQNNITCELGTIANGSYENIMVIVRVPKQFEDGTELTNTACIADTDNCDETTTTVTGVTPEADLNVVKTDSPDPIRAGDELTYTVTVTNDGPEESTDVVLTDMLPSNINFVSATPEQGSCSEETGIVNCNLGNIASGSSVNIIIVVNPLTNGQTTGYVEISNFTSVTASTSDPHGKDNSASTTTIVTPNADLSIAKTDSPDPVLAGYQLTYTVTVTNNGPTAAVNVMVNDTLPEGLSYVSATPDQGTCGEIAGVVTCSLGVINNNNSVNIEIIGIVSSETPNDTVLTNSATVSIEDNCVEGGGNFVASTSNKPIKDGLCDPVDPNNENDTATAETTVGVTGGGGGGTGTGGGGGVGGAVPETPPTIVAPPAEVMKAAEERKYCLAYDASRPLKFLDVDQSTLLTPYPVAEAKLSDLEKALEVIKDTYIANSIYQTQATQVSDIFAFLGKQWVISGYPTRDARGVPVTQGSTAFIGPFANTSRLELAKVLLLSHCFPIMNATELTTRYNSDEPIHVWDDLPNVELGDPVSNYARDVAYSAQYWWVWDGFWNADTQRFDRAGINDFVTLAQTIKMNDRLGQLVRGESDFTTDAAEGLWWKPYYAHANLELANVITPELLAPWRADEVIKRGEGIYNVLKVMIARDLYSPTDLTAIKAYLAAPVVPAPEAGVTP